MSDGYWAWMEDQLKAESRATGGEPCRICTEAIASNLAWKLRDRHVCSSRCNETLKRRWKAKIRKGEIPAFEEDGPEHSSRVGESGRDSRIFSTLPVTAAFPYEFDRRPFLGDTVERHGHHTEYLPLDSLKGPLPQLVQWLQEDDPSAEYFAIVHRESGAWTVGSMLGGHFGRLSVGRFWLGGVEIAAWNDTPIPELDSIQFGIEFISDVDESGEEYEWEAPVFSPFPPAMLWTPSRQALSDKRNRITRQKSSYAARMRALGILNPEMGSVDPLEILERDGWICQLCSDPINRSLLWPHKMSPTMDHVLAVTKGGSHYEENLQSAHLSCNISKGNRAVEPTKAETLPPIPFKESHVRDIAVVEG